MKVAAVKGFIVGIFATVIVGSAVNYGINVVKEKNNDQSISSTVETKLDILEKYIDMFYLDSTEGVDLQSGIYKGFVNSLGDAYSGYYTAEEYAELIESQSGEYCGVGMLVSQNTETGVITIIKVYEGTPAEAEGMKDEDVLYKVEGEEVTGVELEKVVTRIKGEEGTKVKLTVYRASTDEYIDLEIERKTIMVPTVEYSMLDEEEKIGYISVMQFDENTDEMFVKAIEELQKQGMKKVVFDLRNNPGGLYTTVCNMLDKLLPEGTLVYTLDKNGEKEEQKSDKEFLDMPMAVLINGESASASEIFAGAIQDYDAGVIVGTQSFGKGIVQSLFPLKDGSAIKLTVSKYYTPNGVNIHGTGITPDVEVELPKDATEDVQLKKAVEELKK